MYQEIEAKTLLQPTNHADAWFGVHYNFNLYRGCEHQCIYCDSRSECYQIANFADVIAKVNAPQLLAKELSRKRSKRLIGTGAMGDPYTPAERHFRLTKQCIEVILQFGFPLHLVTKSAQILDDLPLLRRFPPGNLSVAITVTTSDDALSAIIEPYASSSSQRFEAIRQLSEAGILTGVLLMPVLPFLEDNEGNVAAVLRNSKEAGAQFVISQFGVTLRDRQRDYFYKELDKQYPSLREKYEQQYGDHYCCYCNNHKQLERFFHQRATEMGLVSSMQSFVERWRPHHEEQLTIW